LKILELPITYVGVKKIVIYLQTSPATGRTKAIHIDGQPIGQLSMCMEYIRLVMAIPEENLVYEIIYDYSSNRNTTNSEGIVRLMAKILDGEVSHVVATCSNRFSGIDSNLFSRVCEERQTKIHLAANIGIDFNTLVDEDAIRVSQNKNSYLKYQQSNNDLFNQLGHNEQEHHNMICALKKKLHYAIHVKGNCVKTSGHEFTQDHLDVDVCSNAQDDYIAEGDVDYDNSDDDVPKAIVVNSKKRLTNGKRSNVNDNVQVTASTVANSKWKCLNERTAGTRRSLCNINPNINYCRGYDKDSSDEEESSDEEYEE
jgi:hypothetical protein